MASTTKGRRNVYNLVTKQNKVIKLEQIQEYLGNGWVLSKNGTKKELRFCLCNCGESFLCAAWDYRKFFNKEHELTYFKNGGHRINPGVRPKIPREIRTCECAWDCGETFECKINSKRRFMPSHGSRGKIYTDDQLKKRKELDCTNGEYTCTICKKVFSSKRGLDSHLSSVNPNKHGIKTKICPKCDKPFTFLLNEETKYCSDTCYKKSQIGCKVSKEGVAKSVAGRLKLTEERGYYHSEETLAKIGASNLGNKPSEEQCKNASITGKRLWGTPEYIEMMNKRKTSYITGWFDSDKNNKPIYFQSSYELLAYLKLEADGNVVGYSRCSFGIPYIFESEAHTYIPDVMVYKLDDSKELLEIKPINFLRDPVNVSKFGALAIYSNENLMKHRIVSYKELLKFQRSPEFSIDFDKIKFDAEDGKERFLKNWRILNATK